MARNWKDVRADVASAGLIDEQRVENSRKDMQAEVRAHKLADVRKSQHVNQSQVAHSMHVSQSRVSNIERGRLESTELGTLKSYVEALGGKLRIVADFGDESIVVRD